MKLEDLPPHFHLVEEPKDVGGFSIPGWRFGRLTTVSAVKSKKWIRPRYVLFKCECGKHIKLGIVKIRRRGIPETCGEDCKLGPLLPVKKLRLAEKYPQEYAAWANYHKKWSKKWSTFKRFIRDIGPKPKGLTMCRKNLNRKHGPGNSYWGMRNSDISKLTWCGHKVTKGWASKVFNIPYYYIEHRIRQGDGKMEIVMRKWHQYQQVLKERKAQD